jgi:hypothetical protein
MKQVFKSILIAVCFVLALNVFSVSNAEANVSNKKSDIIIVRTQEGDKTYISIYGSDGALIMKVAEL